MRHLKHDTPPPGGPPGGGGPGGDLGALLESLLSQGGGGGRIRCPHCQWRPRKHDRWSCRCGHAWNTFETGGVCPACAHRWLHTVCLRCLRWGRHEDWYEKGSTPPPG
jgi:DNA-directed RNA polymerase subunit RPC12/RpoP